MSIDASAPELRRDATGLARKHTGDITVGVLERHRPLQTLRVACRQQPHVRGDFNRAWGLVHRGRGEKPIAWGRRYLPITDSPRLREVAVNRLLLAMFELVFNFLHNKSCDARGF